MTDFLSTLVDRALDRAPVLERRHLSVFETTPGNTPLDDHGSEHSWRSAEENTFLNAASSERQRTIELSLTARKIDRDGFAAISPAGEREGAQAGGFRKPSLSEVPWESEQRHEDRKHAPVSSATESGDLAGARAELAAELLSPSPAPPVVAPFPLLVSETIVEKQCEPSRSDGPSVPELQQNDQAHDSDLRRMPLVVKPVAVRAIGSHENSEMKPGSVGDHRVESQIATGRKPAATRELLRSIVAQPVVTPTVAQAIGPDENGDQKQRSLATQQIESLLPSISQRSPPDEPIRPMARPRTLPARRSRPAVKDAPPVTPTVQVTIGRIEVRATTPASTRTHGARPAAPRLSLDDYLRSRGGASK